MNAATPLVRTATAVLPRLARTLTAGICVVFAACGGSADAPPPPETAVPPTITLQPASVSVMTGQPARFSVAASGTAPITYQWERNGNAIAGATLPTYTIATTAMSDSGAVFSAIATNVAGSATSENATLSVTAAGPVLTITQQPVDTVVVVGSTTTYRVGATCSSGTLDVQWQARVSPDGPFLEIQDATSTTFSFIAATGADGESFRAVLDCDGQSTATSNDAGLAVTGPTNTAVPTITLQPMSINVITGHEATFTVGATCSSGTLAVQWVLSEDTDNPVITDATSTTLSFPTNMLENDTQYYAVLDCSGSSAPVTNTNVVTLGVGAL